MTPEQEALRAAFLAELWPTCRELSREEREAKRVADEIACAWPVDNSPGNVDRKAS